MNFTKLTTLFAIVLLSMGGLVSSKTIDVYHQQTTDSQSTSVQQHQVTKNTIHFLNDTTITTFLLPSWPLTHADINHNNLLSGKSNDSSAHRVLTAITIRHADYQDKTEIASQDSTIQNKHTSQTSQTHKTVNLATTHRNKTMNITYILFIFANIVIVIILYHGWRKLKKYGFLP